MQFGSYVIIGKNLKTRDQLF